MSRRGCGSVVNSIIREAEREAKRQKREAIRQAALNEKIQKQNYIQRKMDRVDELNEELNETVKGLLNILEYSLLFQNIIIFDSLKIHDAGPEYNPPSVLIKQNKKPSLDSFLDNVKVPGVLNKLIPGWENRYNEAKKFAQDSYNKYLKHYEEAEAKRENELDKYKSEYDKKKNAWDLKVQQKNDEVDNFEMLYNKKDIDAVIKYNSMILDNSEYSYQFPQNFRITYANNSQELVVEYQLPTINIVPTAKEYKYVKSRDAIDEKTRKQAEVKELYKEVISAICLRTIHEIFEADQGNIISSVVFNGYVETVDPATGKDIKPFLISIRALKEKFTEINLNRIDKKACLQNLGAQVSPHPEELQPVKPIIEFNMVDKRFVKEQDVLSGLDNRTNLMDLNPFEFENLVANLFQKMGLETKQTRSSKDGGVDAIAFDNRPVLGGKVVIQAKRYKNVVGVSAVRDLYGTMMNEGANKGILVTTSHYGVDAYDFSKNKPIELIDGGQLLYLLNQVGIEAKIIFPVNN